ncbi:Yip1-domain-containing protein [Mycena latifolia]|nr:Yip1-domain-containing protein [Mycena latifolia]
MAGYLQNRGAQPLGGFWTVEYYQSYFDIDTKTVLQRCTATLLPSMTDFLSSHLNPADLYGPFWTATTLVLVLFLSSLLGAPVSSYLSAPGTPYAYDFGLLSVAAGLVYAYALALPVLMWAALRWMGVVEAVAALVGVGFGLSGYFLVCNVYPILSSADSKSLCLLVLVLLALSFKVLFFNYYVVAPAGPAADLPGTGGPVVGAPGETGGAPGAGNETAEAVVMVRRMLFA